MSTEIRSDQAFKWGLFRVMLGAPEHIADRIKTELQVTPAKVGINQLIARMLHEKGFVHGIGAGFIPQMTHMAIRQGGRFFVLSMMPGAIQENFKAHKIIALVATSGTLSCIEVACTPLDLLKTRMMTMPRIPRGILYTFWQDQPLKEIYRGWAAQLCKQNASWGSFVLANHYLKLTVQQYTGENRLNFPQLLGVGFSVATISTFCSQPFDGMLTEIQKTGSVTTSMVQAAKKTVQQGVRGVFKGFAPRWMGSIYKAVTTIVCLSKAEEHSKVRR